MRLSKTDRRLPLRFGPRVHYWQEPTSPKNHMVTGLFSSFTYFMVYTLLQMMFSLFYKQHGMFWRNLLALTALSIEIRLVLSPDNMTLWSPFALLLPWEKDAATRHTGALGLRQLFFSLNSVIQQVGAQLPEIPEDPTELKGGKKRKAEMELNGVVLQHSEKIAALSKVLQQHSRELLQEECVARL